MSENKGGAQADQDGVNDQDQKNDSATTTETKETVSKADLERALSDLHKYKKAAKELQDKLEQSNSARLKEKEDYKSLYEQYEAKWKEEQESHAKTKVQVEYDKKFQSAYMALKKEGLIEEAEKLLERDSLDDLVLERTDQGRFIVHGKDAMIQRWKKDFPFAFKSQTAPKINSGGGRKEDLTTGEVSVQKVLEAEKQYKSGKITKDDYTKVVNLFRNKKKA